MSETLALLHRPSYPPAFAGRLVGLAPERVRRWLHGYNCDYVTVGGEHRTYTPGPVVVRDSDNSEYASFLDLMDLLFVRRFLDHGVPLQRVRKAIREATTLIGDTHFAHRKFFTNGHEIYLQVEHGHRSKALMHLLSGGQWAIAPVIEKDAATIDFDPNSGFATRWYPRGRETGIIVDPTIAFGTPAVAGYGVKTSVVYDLYEAEGKDLRAVSSWLEISPGEAQNAVTFEESLRAA